MTPLVNDTIIRLYRNEDRGFVLSLLKQNTPKYFSPEEESDFIYYLEHELDLYFVVEIENQIIGCGGINRFPEQHLAKISWDIIHPDFQGKSIGKKLLQYRLNLLQKEQNLHTIQVRTSQITYRFYEKNEFELRSINKDYWAKGFDLYDMILKK